MSERNDLKRLLKATARIEAIYRINAPLNPADDKPIAECIPGVWPTMGELREVVEVADELRKRYRINLAR
jgi:hypothetical protein